MSRQRVLAIFRKEMREFRRNKQVIYTMVLSPIGFLVAPVIFLFTVSASDASTLQEYPVLLFTLAMAALVPVTVGAYSITGERDQGTLEPVLGTPILAREFLLGKAPAVLVPGAAESYLVFGVIDALVWVFSMIISARVSDVRVAQQIGTLIMLPVIALAVLFGFHVLHVTVLLGVTVGAALAALDAAGLLVVSAVFDRERLVLGTR